MSAAATWPGLLGGGRGLSRTNGLWAPARSSRLINGYPSNGNRLGTNRLASRTSGGIMDRDESKRGEKPVTRRENTAARAAAGLPAVPPADVDWTALVERCLRGDGGA